MTGSTEGPDDSASIDMQQFLDDFVASMDAWASTGAPEARSTQS